MSSDVSRSVGHTAQMDFFICHASEDKEAAARPIYTELVGRGHSVWLDEAELTLGDSLRQSIDHGLANCRFGVVVLSHAFFRKNWPQYELDGLMDRQMSGTKTVLPVWHDIRHDDIAARSPSLAGLYATSTNNGIAAVADEIMRAYVRASTRDLSQSIVESPDTSASDTRSAGPPRLPLTDDERDRVRSDYAGYWESVLFADVLVRGLLAHEPAWRDHQLRLVRPTGHHVTREGVANYLDRTSQDLTRITSNLERLGNPSVQEAVFGPPGQPGDATAIEHVGQRLVAIYGQCLEWAADVRSTHAPEEFDRLLVLLGNCAEEPIVKFRTFVSAYLEELVQVPELLRAGGDQRLTIEVKLHLRDDAIQEYNKELRRLQRRRKL